MNEEKFPNTRKPSHQQVCGEFWNLRGQHNSEENTHTHTHTHTHIQNMHLTTTASGQAAQILMSATSEQGLDREAQATLLRVRTGPECREDNLRELK